MAWILHDHDGHADAEVKWYEGSPYSLPAGFMALVNLTLGWLQGSLSNWPGRRGPGSQAPRGLRFLDSWAVSADLRRCPTRITHHHHLLTISLRRLRGFVCRMPRCPSAEADPGV